MPRLFALFALAAIVVAHSAPEDAPVAENFVQSAPEFVESQDNHYMNAENVLAELKTVTADKSWKSMETDFFQQLQNEDRDTKMAMVFSLRKIAKMDPEVLGHLTMEALNKDQRDELVQFYKNKNKNELVQAEFWGGRRRRRFFRAVKRTFKKVGRHVRRAVRHVRRAVRKVGRHIKRAVRHVGKWAAKAARAVGKVIVNAVKALGRFLKRLAAKLCRKVMRAFVKKVHKYIKKHVTKFCIKLCIKAAGKVFLLGAGSPVSAAVAAAIGAGCSIGCKLAFKALIKFIRRRYLNNAQLDDFVADFVCDSIGLKSGGGGGSGRRRSSRRRSSRRRSGRRRSSRRRSSRRRRRRRRL